MLAEHVTKLRDILAQLEAAQTVTHMDLPGYRLHALKGDLKGFHAVTVRFVGRDAFDVDYVGYH